jgi:hypothetical protein
LERVLAKPSRVDPSFKCLVACCPSCQLTNWGEDRSDEESCEHQAPKVWVRICVGHGEDPFLFCVYAVYIEKRCTLVNEQFAYRSLIIEKVQKSPSLSGLGLF